MALFESKGIYSEKQGAIKLFYVWDLLQSDMSWVRKFGGLKVCRDT